MPTLNLGRVGFVNKGTWLISTAYKINDTVTYLGGTYACLIANTGQTPILGGTIYWQEWVANDVVTLTGDQTVVGIKSFTNGIKVEGANITAYGKNYIINGGFDYWNYATSQTSNGYGSDDRWNNGDSGSTKVHSQVASGDTERAFFSSSKFSRTVVTSIVGINNNIRKNQPIENITKLAGKTVTISFWAKADTAKNIAIELVQIFGTGGAPSSDILGIGAQLIALTSTWQKKSITVTIPSIIGKTLGTNGVHTSFTNMYFWFDAGSNLNTRTANLGQQSGTFDIAEVKLEEGSVATPWTPYEGEFGGEVQACQRYLPRIDYPTNGAVGSGNMYTSVIGIVNIKFPTTTRIPPTGAVFSAVNAFTWYAGGTSFASTALIAANYTKESVEVQGTISGATAGHGAIIRATGVAYIYLTGCEL